MLDGKNFDAWNLLKQNLHGRDVSKLFYKEGEIWFCSIGVNIGWEKDGKNETFDRPVIILKKFWPSLFLGIPCTTKKQSGRGVYKFVLHATQYTALFSQIRVLDCRRLRRLVAVADGAVFRSLCDAFKVWL